MVPPHQYFFIETPSLERLPTKAKQDPSPHEMRLSPARHQPSISQSWGFSSAFWNWCSIIK